MNKPAIPAERIILGIDPGTTILGYGIIKVEGKKMSLMALGVLHLEKYSDVFSQVYVCPEYNSRSALVAFSSNPDLKK